MYSIISRIPLRSIRATPILLKHDDLGSRMLFLQGSHVYTPFRHQQILFRLKQKQNTVRSVEAIYGYFVDSEKLLSRAEQERLERLLPKAYFSDYPKSAENFSVWVTPRLGTISPWSSKATDIAHNCEIPINRIERGIYFIIDGIAKRDKKAIEKVASELYDPLTESLLFDAEDLAQLFQHPVPKTFNDIPVLGKGEAALKEADQNLGLALSDPDIHYLLRAFHQLNRNPTDIELMMFAQVNSEHCRHKIFNAQWTIDGKEKKESLFDMIRYTYKTHPEKILVAYKDNAAVIEGFNCESFLINPSNHSYEKQKGRLHTVLKVETHNHPTAIAPFAGAATGSGGEIRDEAATGRGAQSLAGLAGFSVSHLRIPDFLQPWEKAPSKKSLHSDSKPKTLASALDIMLQGPIGAASFSNEFGRPTICGYFRTLEHLSSKTLKWGYHKPIMIAGGIGHIRESQIEKQSFTEGALLVVLGGPAMAIGLGGGSASSRTSGESTEALDFASVQRANPEMQRRAQEVINACLSLGDDNPILSLHDVGAGGLSNAFPELVHATECGGEFELRHIPNAEPGMSPLEIWCNEAQERFVLAIKPESLKVFSGIAERERCPFAVVGRAKEEKKLILNDAHFHNRPIDLPLSFLFEDMPPMKREDKRVFSGETAWNISKINWADAVKRVLQYPCVADKSFLITIGDRTVGGMVARDQMVGPWQIPVADVAVTAHSFTGYEGQALAMGERSPIAIVHPAASARMAVGEAITNIAAAPIKAISDIVLSANWMAAPDQPGEGAGLYEAVQTVAKELCPALGICIPVGKDSLSMQTSLEKEIVTAPLSLIITATAPVSDVRHALTPQLQTDVGETRLLLIDLGQGPNFLGGSCLAQTYNLLGKQPPDVDDPLLLRRFFEAIQSLNQKNLLLAYHDRSDGGLLATLCEMAFTAHVGITIKLDSLGDDALASVFNEELGAVIQVKEKNIDIVFEILKSHKLQAHSHVIGELNQLDEIIFNFRGQTLYQETRTTLQRWWSETSYRLQSLRDNPECAKQQYDGLLDKKDTGLFTKITFDNNEDIALPYINSGKRPRVAILREQGTNGHREMAAAFHLAGFESVDVHMSDLLNERVNLMDFKGAVAGGGFSYGDVLGAGRGWAQVILMHPKIRDKFSLFFESKDRFALGVCNGCQLFSHLKSLIPGALHWPAFQRNVSEQFEARLSMVEIPQSPSLFFQGMAGSQLPVAVAHGEGRVVFEKNTQEFENEKLIALRYVNYAGQPTENYPANPNGSPKGITGLTTPDGRITILMPHPERVFRTVQFSWHPKQWSEMSPWMRIFKNARKWVG
ncbi:phosphoribosylformylglycinamidine synthase [Coxiella burnetii]|uniref:phosphoribosylformylglycinamidine synthase n=1 Tax=Coxiella burnetii TaxID=777 RepID=UPI000183D098|nr:phosphoribosylformylglycinamidine synthase [Coxiella burnetii]ACJ18678.1 phosphoribosylformylglycinamidine synthase [Coxiella burnetii CbuG_Q212]OYK85949.1 phosphoribosylformylglycinamidine synthase [Coxiella burnetii]